MDYWGDPGNAVVELPEHPADRGLIDRAYPADFPGYAGREVEKHASPVQWSETADGATSDGWWAQADPGIDPNWSEGGVQASPTGLPYSTGVVDPSTVENQELTGRILVPGRDREHARGPVGATEYRDNLIMQIVQAMGPELSEEMAAAGLIGGF